MPDPINLNSSAIIRTWCIYSSASTTKIKENSSSQLTFFSERLSSTRLWTRPVYQRLSRHHLSYSLFSCSPTTNRAFVSETPQTGSFRPHQVSCLRQPRPSSHQSSLRARQQIRARQAPTSHPRSRQARVSRRCRRTECLGCDTCWLLAGCVGGPCRDAGDVGVDKLRCRTKITRPPNSKRTAP